MKSSNVSLGSSCLRTTNTLFLLMEPTISLIESTLVARILHTIGTLSRTNGLAVRSAVVDISIYLIAVK